MNKGSEQFRINSKLPADIVWGAAVACDRLYDGEYYKQTQFENDPEIDEMVEKHKPNKVVVKRWLATGCYEQITDEDIEKGQALRHYFKGWVMKEIKGNINEFEAAVLVLSQRDEFTNRDLLAFSTIACLPSTYRRVVDHNELCKNIRESIPLMADKLSYVSGDLIIVKCEYNTNYNKYRIQGRFGESFVDFWLSAGAGIKANDIVKIKGRIKQHRADGSTQLNYVKLI